MNFKPFSIPLLIFIAIIISAACVTNMKSITIGAFPLLIYAIIHERKIPNINFGLVAILGFFSGLALSFPFWINFITHPDDYILLTGDLHFYSRVSDYIFDLGIENNSLDYFSSGVKPQPYHYSELWLTGMISRFLGLNSDISFIIAIFGVLWPCLYLSLVCLSRKLCITGNKVYWIPLIFPLIGSFPFLYPQFIPFLSQEIYDIPLVTQSKTIIVSIFASWGLLGILNNKFDLAICHFFIGGILYFPVLPVITFLVVIFLIRKIFTDGAKFTLREYKYLFSTGVLGIIYLFLLYTNQSSESPSQDISQATIILSELGSNYFQTILNILGKTSIGLAISFGPYLIVALVFLKLSRKDLLKFGCFTLGSIFVWTLFHPLYNSVQLWANFFFPVVHIMILILIIYLFRKKALWGGLIFAVIAVLGITLKKNELIRYTQVYSSQDISTLARVIDEPEPSKFSRPNKSINLGIVRDWKKPNRYFGYSTAYLPLNDIRIFGTVKHFTVNLNDFIVDENDLFQIRFKRSSPLSLWNKRNPDKLFLKYLLRETSNEVCVIYNEINEEITSCATPISQ